METAKNAGAHARGPLRWLPGTSTGIPTQAANNEIIADSSEGYVDKADCEHGIELVRTLAPTVPLNDLT